MNRLNHSSSYLFHNLISFLLSCRCCCVLPPVWKFSSASVQFFCCAAAPNRLNNRLSKINELNKLNEINEEDFYEEPVLIVAGGTEGRLYLFSFMNKKHPENSPFFDFFSSPNDSEDESELIQGLVKCSMCILTPGCYTSEIRCCSFLPAEGSSLIALALRAKRSRTGSLIIMDLFRAAAPVSAGSGGVAVRQGQGVFPDTAAMSVVEGNCGCCRSREIQDLIWSSLSSYLLASAENALLINLQKRKVKQLPLNSLLYPNKRKINDKNENAEDVERCCWGCTSIGPLVFYAFNGGW